MSLSRRTALVLDAIELARQVVSTLPSSRDVEELRLECGSCDAVVRGWEGALPSTEEREQLMKRLIALQIRTARAARSAPPIGSYQGAP